ncbi:SAM-dependent methyltransferase [Streptomyces sp. NRRL B-1140]|uniref:class I SAM-dependent methyltransferase n=1 Tax=Streptomyces sp. NRRL B-1140 TaxID=1415549 RepID=UPI0006AE858F|nr:class I SAM-dependent methyltransferase [Streptomyces sp. NRRL B-1140]KOX04492.1 SAM-dependent methyltransferase [Streptomyces sp. NRRL B-1140]
MTSLTRRALRGLERFHAARPWDHNAHFHRWILRQLPERVGSALDVGCGSGDLARLLTGRAARVHGIDTDPAITARARELTPVAAPVTYTVTDATTGLGDRSYDVITCVAVVHHLPFTEALETFRDHLATGGTLVLVGVARERTPVDHLLGLASIPLNVLMALLKNRGRPAPRPDSMSAPTRPADLTFPEIAREARAVLPGVRLRRRLFWRYTLVWRRL